MLTTSDNNTTVFACGLLANMVLHTAGKMSADKLSYLIDNIEHEGILGVLANIVNHSKLPVVAKVASCRCLAALWEVMPPGLIRALLESREHNPLEAGGP